jgi:hypothetical protein
MASSSAGVSCGTSTRSDSDSTPPDAQILMTSAPYFSCSRTARRHESAPLHTPSASSYVRTVPRGNAGASQWPPVEPIACTATSMRGPSSMPALIALRRATSM